MSEPAASSLDSLRKRKLVQWGAGYAAGAWIALQVLSLIGQQFDWSPELLRAITIAFGLGFFVTVVLAWFHGERGEQKVTLGEVGILAVLVALGAGLMWRTVLRPDAAPAPPSAATAAPEPARVAIPRKSIAVLAFADLSAGHDQDYFSDGMAEEILNALAKVKDLKVAGRTSSFYYKGRNEDLRAIGKALGVAHVLEGSVRKQGDKVRITAQLIRSEDGFHLWSDTYDGELSDVFELQERIARAITGKLEVLLQGGQQERLVHAATANPEAYALYLQATGTFNRRDGPHMREAIAQLEEATRLDPAFARAHSRMAALHAISVTYAQATLAAAYEGADAELQAAMKLDPELAEPHAVLGYIRAEQRRHVEARHAFERALELDPDDVTANLWNGITLTRSGYIRQGTAVFDHLLAVDPLLPNGLNWRGLQYVFAGDLVNAERLLRRAEEIGLSNAGWGLSGLADAQGRRADAMRYMAAMMRVFRGELPEEAPDAIVQGVYGDAAAKARAIGVIDAYLATKPAHLNSIVPFALIRMGEPGRALKLAGERPTGNDGFWLARLWGPEGRAARATPEFQDFILRAGLVELWQAYGEPDMCRKTGDGGYRCS